MLLMQIKKSLLTKIRTKKYRNFKETGLEMVNNFKRKNSSQKTKLLILRKIKVEMNNNLY